MLTEIQVTSSQGEQLALTLSDVSNGYIVKSISGLGPVDTELTSTDYASLDGAQLQAKRRVKRTMVFKIELIPGAFGLSVRELRKRLYRVFTYGEVSFAFMLAGESPLTNKGYVESFEPDLWAKEPTVDITVVCFDPNFEVPTVQTVTGASSTTNELSVMYDGMVDTGVVFSLIVTSATNGVTITNRHDSGLVETFAFPIVMAEGDELRISTVPGNKYVVKRSWLFPDNGETSMVYGVSPQSSWFVLSPGRNRIKVNAGSSAAIPYTIEYTEKHGGI